MLGGAGRINKTYHDNETDGKSSAHICFGIGPCGTRLNEGSDGFVSRGPSILGSSRTVRSTSDTTGSGVPSQFQTSHHDRGLRLRRRAQGVG